MHNTNYAKICAVYFWWLYWWFVTLFKWPPEVPYLTPYRESGMNLLTWCLCLQRIFSIL